MNESLGAVRADIVRTLSEAGIAEAEIEADIILREVTSLDSSSLIAHKDRLIHETEQKQITSIVRDRSARSPLAHVLCHTEFYGHRFKTSPAALIPRQETEILVEKTLAIGIEPGAIVLDLACGSGCIGISLALARPDIQVHMSDISSDALSLASENAERLGAANVRLFLSDWFENLSGNSYAAILTNPPYIHPDEAESLMPEVLHDPPIALFDPDPPALYLKIFSTSVKRLIPHGFFLSEISPRWAQVVLADARKVFGSAELIDDYAHLTRFVLARKETSL